jgi:hypothetical protein
MISKLRPSSAELNLEKKDNKKSQLWNGGPVFEFREEPDASFINVIFTETVDHAVRFTINKDLLTIHLEDPNLDSENSSAQNRSFSHSFLLNGKVDTGRLEVYWEKNQFSLKIPV